MNYLNDCHKQKICLSTDLQKSRVKLEKSRFDNWFVLTFPLDRAYTLSHKSIRTHPILITQHGGQQTVAGFDLHNFKKTHLHNDIK